MRRFFQLFFLFFLLSIAFPSLAQITVSADISPNEISLEDEATITVTVNGAANVSAPTPPSVPGLEIVHTGSSVASGSSFSITVNGVPIQSGSSSSSATFFYTVVASDAGTFSIPPFTLSIQSKEYKTNALTLKVASNTAASPTPNFGSPFPPSQQPVTPAPQTASRPFFLTATVSQDDPWVHQHLLYRLKLYSRVNGTIVDYEMPEFADFLAEPLAEGKQGKEILQGQSYSTYEIVYLLKPLKAGKQVIPPAKLSFRHFDAQNPGFDPFFRDPFFSPGSQAKTSHLKSDGVTLNVADLPQPIPSDFTNLIGRFSVSAGLSGTSLVVGDTVTYALSITGEGNIKDGILPDVTIPDVKAYPDKPELKLTKDENGVRGTKTFRMALVPATAGEHRIPERTLSYLDTETGQYETIRLSEIPFTVTPSPDQPRPDLTLSTPQSATSDAPNELAPLWDRPEAALAKPLLRLSDGIFLCLVFALPLAFGSVWLLKNWQAVGTNASRAQKRQRKLAIQGLLQALSRPNARSDALLESLRLFFAPFTSSRAKALTPAEMEAICLSQGVDAETGRRLRQIADNLEAAHYGFDKEATTEALRKDLQEVMKNVIAKMGRPS